MASAFFAGAAFLIEFGLATFLTETLTGEVLPCAGLAGEVLPCADATGATISGIATLGATGFFFAAGALFFFAAEVFAGALEAAAWIGAAVTGAFLESPPF